MKIGVMGASGCLGSEIVKTLIDLDVNVWALASCKRPEWGNLVVHHPFNRASSRQELSPIFEQLDVLINTAPISSAQLPEVAVEAGCHVIDVGINREIISQTLQLDELASHPLDMLPTDC